MFTSPGEIAFQIGPLQVHYYGLTMGLAMLVGVFLANKIAEKLYPELPKEIVFDVAPYVIIGAILGARLYYCLLTFDYYIKNPVEIFQIWEGGLSIQGGLLGGLIFGFLYAKRHKLPVLKLCDIFAYGICVGQAIGRWGNFFNSEAFGRPTNFFLKLYVPIYERPVKYLQYQYFHPTFLYASICDALIFFILFFGVRKIIYNLKSNPKNKKSYDGIIFFSYLILYSIVRFAIERLRIDSVLNIFNVPIAEIVCILTIVIATIGIYFILNKEYIINKILHSKDN